MAKKIILTRLPVGHTHDDMDAIFGLLWKWMSGRIIETIDKFKEGVKESFSHHNSKLKAKVVFVDLVPNYQSFFAGSIDPLLGKYTKEELTQHRWSFEAVENSSEFPFGVKTMYKTYAADKVVEIFKIPKEDCITDLGQLTGLEPRTTYSRWYPTSNSIETRIGVEGFYLLTKVPCTNDLSPCEFDERGVKQYSFLYKKIQHLWLHDDPNRIWWDKFMLTSPRGTAKEYLDLYPIKFHQPLQSFFKSKTFNRSTSVWTITTASNSFSDICWPSELAACMPSVVTTFTRHPGPSRVVCTDDEIVNLRLSYFNERSINYYDELKQLTITNIMDSIIKSRWTYNGEQIHSVDTKSTLINAIKRDDNQLFKRYFRSINGESSYLVEKKLYEVYYRPHQADEHVCEFKLGQDIKHLSLEDFRTFGKACNLSLNAMNYCQHINQRKQFIFHKSYEDLYRDSRNYNKLKEILFATSIELHSLEDDTTNAIEWNTIKDNRSIILPIIDSNSKKWMFVLIDFNIDIIFYFNPVDKLFSNLTFKQRFKRSIIRRFNLQGDNWDIQPLRSTMVDATYDGLENDSGIIAIATIFFISQHCPLFYNKLDIDVFRINFCFDLLRSLIDVVV